MAKSNSATKSGFSRSKGAATAERLDIHEGDIVTIEWRDGTRTKENCVGVNHATGKVAIMAIDRASSKRWVPAQQVVATESPE